MGRCGRGREREGENVDYFEMSVSLRDYIYMYERCHDLTEKEDGVMTVKDQVDDQTKNLLLTLQLCVLNNGCWHQYLERYAMNPT